MSSQNQKVLSLILCSLLLIGLVPVAAQAEGESEPPTVEAPEFSGSDTEEDPYLISSADDLTCLAKFVNEGNADISTILTMQADLQEHPIPLHLKNVFL